MINPSTNQSFSVDDIRRIREKDDRRYQGMTSMEIARDIHERAAESRRIMAEIKERKAKEIGRTQ